LTLDELALAADDCRVRLLKATEIALVAQGRGEPRYLRDVDTKAPDFQYHLAAHNIRTLLNSVKVEIARLERELAI
jgi:hypothetical protein